MFKNAAKVVIFALTDKKRKGKVNFRSILLLKSKILITFASKYA